MGKIETFPIKEVIQECGNVSQIVFDKKFDARAGQFVMVWIPGTDEVPMSLASENSIIVKDAGEATHKLLGMKAGDLIGLRGPFGHGFEPQGKVLGIAGGTGIAPIRFLKAQHPETEIVFGVNTKNELICPNETFKTCSIDGTCGQKGFPTDLADEVLGKEKYDLIVTCGPEAMMVKALELGKKHGVPVQASLERLMKCGGIGVCGSCVLDPSGLRVCKEGPVFTNKQLDGTNFGKYKRKSSGGKEWFK